MAVSHAELQSQIKPINFATKRKASKNNGRVRKASKQEEQPGVPNSKQASKKNNGRVRKASKNNRRCRTPRSSAWRQAEPARSAAAVAAGAPRQRLAAAAATG